MKTKITVSAFTPAQSGSWPARDMEQTGALVAIAKVGKEWREPVRVRWWMGRSKGASTVRCTVWIAGRAGEYASGTGTAGGYGYHRSSAALDSAIRAAGVQLSQGIAGAGDRAMEEAVRAIAAHVGYKKVHVVGA